MTDHTDLKSRLSGHIALDDVKLLMAEALGAIERLERELENEKIESATLRHGLRLADAARQQTES